MAVYSRQEALSTSAEVVLDSSLLRYANASTPIQVSVRNDDGSLSMYVGGAGVTTATGYEVLAGTSFSYLVRSVDEVLYIVAASGTPTAHIIAIGPVSTS